MEFINKLNEGKAEKDQWKVIVDPDDISKFSIIAPASAKAGDFAAIPVEYTYTNGSKDVHWFHFVVQDPEYNTPSYEVQVDFPTTEMKSDVTVTDDDKKDKPIKYTIDEEAEYTDDKGNVWDVSIDESTGEVTAKPKAKPDGETFNGGEKLKVPVTAHYKDTDETVETTAEFVLKEKSLVAPDYDAKNGKAGDELTFSPKQEEDNYNRKPFRFTLGGGSLEGTYEDDKGNEWNVKIDPNTGKVTANVPKAEEGETIDLDGTIINVPVTAHYKDADGNDIGSKKVNVQFLGSGTEGTHTYTEQIPFETTVEVVDDLEPGEWRYKKDADGKDMSGKLGSKTTTWKIKDSVVQNNPEITEEAPVNAVIQIGKGTTEINIEPIEKVVEKGYNTVYEYDESLDAGKLEEKTPAQNGKTTITISYYKESKKLVTSEKTVNPVDRVVKIGIKPIEKETKLSFETEIIFDDEMEAGKTEVIQKGKEGKAKITTFFNGKTGKLETKVERIEPEKKIIKVGAKNVCPIPDPTPDPDQPDKPVDPEKPVTPEEPDKPDTPDTPDPEKPEDPGTPEKPENSETPENPEKPETPEIPENPDNPGTPEKPENPEEPGRPDKPKEPSDKESPERPDSPKENLKEEKKEETIKVKQSKDKSKNPKTGIESIAPIFTSMGISISGLMATRKKKKEDE